MLDFSDIERIAYITNNAQALQLCTDLDDTQGELDEVNARIDKMEDQITSLEQDNLMLTEG
jgi:peptidoglycan hydrolase CwlO-like protein